MPDGSTSCLPASHSGKCAERRRARAFYIFKQRKLVGQRFVSLSFHTTFQAAWKATRKIKGRFHAGSIGHLPVRDCSHGASGCVRYRALHSGLGFSDGFISHNIPLLPITYSLCYSCLSCWLLFFRMLLLNHLWVSVPKPFNLWLFLNITIELKRSTLFYFQPYNNSY